MSAGLGQVLAMWPGKRSIGLTIAPQQLEVVCLQALWGGRWRVERAARARLPEGAIGPQGQVADRAAILQALQILFPRRRWPRTVNVSFDGPQVLVRQSRIRALSPAEQRRYLLEQTSRYPNFEQANLAIDFRITAGQADEEQEPGAPREVEILALATRQDTLDAIKDLLLQVGLRAGAVTAGALAAFSVPLRLPRASAPEPPIWAGVALAQAKVVISFWRGERFLFYREVFLDGGRLPPAGPAPAPRPLPPPARQEELEELVTALREAALTAARPGPVREELEQFLRDSPAFSRQAATGLVPPALVNQLLKELNRSFSFHQLADPSTVPIYLFDVPHAPLLCQRLRELGSTLRVQPFRLDALAALELDGWGPSATAVGTALVRPGGSGLTDLGFERTAARWGGWWAELVVAGLTTVGVVVLAFALTFLSAGRYTAGYQHEDQVAQDQTSKTLASTRALQEALPGQGAIKELSTATHTDRELAQALSRLVGEGLPANVPQGLWVEEVGLKEHAQLTLSGQAEDALAILDFNQRLIGLPYLRGMRLLELSRAEGRNGRFRFHIVGTLSPTTLGDD